MSRRRNVLKNIVAKIVLEVRVQKKKPKLSALLKKFRDMDKEKAHKSLE